MQSTNAHVNAAVVTSGWRAFTPLDMRTPARLPDRSSSLWNKINRHAKVVGTLVGTPASVAKGELLHSHFD